MLNAECLLNKVLFYEMRCNEMPCINCNLYTWGIDILITLCMNGIFRASLSSQLAACRFFLYSH